MTVVPVMNKMTRPVDGYLRKNKRWEGAMQELRTIVLDSPLKEEVKWRTPCYTFEDANVVMIGALKDCCVLSFLKGALLKDPQGILVKPGENTQAARIVRFTEVQQVVALAGVLKAYVQEAVEVEKAGMKVAFKKISAFAVPEELRQKFEEVPALKAAFQGLTPGRQRAYLMAIGAAKQAKTRVARVEKYMPQILKGKGIDEE
jgi:uncharacterized protein YdeI (YjbR/CyaY-like superfamily)